MTLDPAAIEQVVAHLRVLYPDRSDLEALAGRLIDAVAVPPRTTARVRTRRWGADDAVLITYADSVRDDERLPLQVLRELVSHLRGAFSTVHVLPFFPSTSDHGFSIVDHREVDNTVGGWDDIDELAADVDLMVDLVCNHLSAGSARFEELVADELPGRDWFVTVAPDTDISAVVRPRAQPLLHRVETAADPRWVWCTFGPDQVDLDLANPEVLVDLTTTLGNHLHHGARFVRLDAIAYLWKEPGTPCIHLERTHETVRLWHTLLEAAAPHAAIVTETNVPNRENLSYFGAGDEAHVVYNFSLPPMVLDALLTGRSRHLTTWMRRMPPAPPGCTYLNFLSSHDGIGVRPAEGILSPEEIDALVATSHERGGLHGDYDAPSGARPYELDIALWDLLAGGDDDLDAARYVCAHAIVFGVEGIPAVWINSLFARGNDHDAVARTGVRREISRSPMSLVEALELLDDPTSPRGRAAAMILRLLRVRAEQPAFDPSATQLTLQLGPALFGFWRQSVDRTQSVFAVHNCTAGPQALDLADLNLIEGERWFDLVESVEIGSIDVVVTLAPYQSCWITNRPPNP